MLPWERQKIATLAALRAPGEAPAKQKTLLLDGERRLVTVMFADMSGFSALFETMDPESVRDAVNGCFERLVPVVQKYGGVW